MYNYDRGGNITSKVKYAYTTGTLGTAQQTISYTYGDSNWKDKLTAYNGTAITYDAIGNPTNDGTWTYTWQAGRQLKQMSKTGTTIRYEYNHEGLRTQKFVDTSNKTDATYYTYNGKNIIHVIKNSDHLHIFYDAQNRPAKVSHNGVFYTYIYNLQGDIVGLVDKDGALVVEYKYDAWGKPLSTTGTMAATLGKLNPFRYRGYVYDDQTGLYYLKNRYYVPAMNRFLNADLFLGKGGILSHNIYAYVKNNPICYADPSGCIIVEINFDNWFESWLRKVKKNLDLLLAAGCHELSAYSDFKKITNKALTIPSYLLNGKAPNRITVTNYSVRKERKNIIGGGITWIINALAQEGMGDAINYYSMYKTGFPLVWDEFDDIIAVAAEISSSLLGETHSVISHTLSVEYEYDNRYSIIAHYVFYSSNDHCIEHYDGIHASVVVQSDGFFPCGTMKYIYG